MIVFQPHINGFWTDIQVGHIVCNLLASFESLKSISDYFRVVNENIHSILTRDESESLLLIEPAHFTFASHENLR